MLPSQTSQTPSNGTWPLMAFTRPARCTFSSSALEYGYLSLSKFGMLNLKARLNYFYGSCCRRLWTADRVEKQRLEPWRFSCASVWGQSSVPLVPLCEGGLEPFSTSKPQISLAALNTVELLPWWTKILQSVNHGAKTVVAYVNLLTYQVLERIRAEVARFRADFSPMM